MARGRTERYTACSNRRKRTEYKPWAWNAVRRGRSSRGEIERPASQCRARKTGMWSLHCRRRKCARSTQLRQRQTGAASAATNGSGSSTGAQRRRARTRAKTTATSRRKELELPPWREREHLRIPTLSTGEARSRAGNRGPRALGRGGRGFGGRQAESPLPADGLFSSPPVVEAWSAQARRAAAHRRRSGAARPSPAATVEGRR